MYYSIIVFFITCLQISFYSHPRPYKAYFILFNGNIEFCWLDGPEFINLCLIDS